MNTLQQRVLKLEAQMNAMAQAWIYLASLVEMEGGMDVMRMEACLRRKRVGHSAGHQPRGAGAAPVDV